MVAFLEQVRSMVPIKTALKSYGSTTVEAAYAVQRPNAL
jgi:hypothetical protein